MIFGLTVQKIGPLFELRCPECTRLGVAYSPLVRESTPTSIRVYCETHGTSGVWASELEMEREKIDLAKRIGLV